MDSILKHTRKADIVFYHAGKIEVKRRLARIIGLRQGDVLNLKTDGCRIYLYLSSMAVWSNGAHEAVCAPTNKGGRHFRAHSVALSRAATELAGIKAGSDRVGFYAGEPMLDAAFGVYVPLFAVL